MLLSAALFGMCREGQPSGINRTYCLYREEGLAVNTVVASPAARSESSASRAIAKPVPIGEQPPWFEFDVKSFRKELYSPL